MKIGERKELKELFFVSSTQKINFFLHSYIYNDNKNIYKFKETLNEKKNVYAFLKNSPLHSRLGSKQQNFLQLPSNLSVI